MSEEVVQVPREAQPLFVDGQAGELFPRRPQLRDGGDLADERGCPQADGSRRQREPRHAGDRAERERDNRETSYRHVGIPGQEHYPGGDVDVEKEHAPLATQR